MLQTAAAACGQLEHLYLRTDAADETELRKTAEETQVFLAAFSPEVRPLDFLLAASRPIFAPCTFNTASAGNHLAAACTLLPVVR